MLRRYVPKVQLLQEMGFEERDRLFKGEFVDITNEKGEIVRLNPDFFIESTALFLYEQDHLDIGKYKGYIRTESVFKEGALKRKIRADYEENKRKCENFKLQCLKKQFQKRLACCKLIESLIGYYVMYLKSSLGSKQLDDSRNGLNMSMKSYNKFVMKPIYKRIVSKSGFFKGKRELERLGEFDINYMGINMERDSVFSFRLRDDCDVTYLSYKLGNRIVLLKQSGSFMVDVSEKAPRINKSNIN